MTKANSTLSSSITEIIPKQVEEMGNECTKQEPTNITAHQGTQKPEGNKPKTDTTAGIKKREGRDKLEEKVKELLKRKRKRTKDTTKKDVGGTESQEIDPRLTNSICCLGNRHKP